MLANNLRKWPGRRWRYCRNHQTTAARWTTTNKSPKQRSTPEVSHAVPKAFAVGGFAGVMGSLAGMGGGFVMIPLLSSSLLRLTQHQAHGTSLFAVTTTGVSGAMGYAGSVDYEAAAAIAGCGMITARLGAKITSRLSERLLKRALGIFMIAVAPMVPAKSYLIERSFSGDRDNDNSPIQAKSEKRSVEFNRLFIPGTIGLGSGFLAGLFGVGGGAVVVPALTVFTDMNHYQALGTSLCAMVLPAMVGTATHYSKGNVSMRVAPGLAIGAFVGGFLGGKLGTNTNEDHLRWGFSGLMVMLGFRTLVKA